MLPPAHYAAGLAAGLVTANATGSPGLGLAAAVLTHLPLDYLVDEYWDWQDDDRLDMAKLLSPLGVVAVLLTFWLALRGGSWPVAWEGHGLGWWPLLCNKNNPKIRQQERKAWADTLRKYLPESK